VVLIALFFGCGIFGFWGLDTTAGRKMFDEMDGMYHSFRL